ncbi:MAG: glutamyl-tRNA reductase [Dehalococcoidia bacterium]|nr:glutamyl-tRNA reductase [Dehalococcoidia bacterium]
MVEDRKLKGPRFCTVGVNYSTTPLVIREKLVIPKTQLQEALVSLRTYVPRGIILSTCNRTEVYALSDDSRFTERALKQFLLDWSHLSAEELTPYLYLHRDYRAMRRLCKITSGLYSMILGEYEILGQTADALEEAEKAKMVDPALRQLFRHAIAIGRKVRAETGISRNALSVSSVAVDLATKAVSADVRSCRVLLVGAGEAGTLATKAFVKRGASAIYVASRSVERAQGLASSLGAMAIDIREIENEMATADIVISCTGSPHFVIHREVVQRSMERRSEKPLAIVDIAVPRDVEPDVSQIENVFLYDIDDLNRMVGTNKGEREKEVQKALAIITAELEHLLEWWQTLEAKPTIGALMQMAEDIRQRQLSMTLKKLPTLTEEQQESLDSMTRAIVNKILDHPVRYVKQHGHQNEEAVRLLREMFALDEVK